MNKICKQIKKEKERLEKQGYKFLKEELINSLIHRETSTFPELHYSGYDADYSCYHFTAITKFKTQLEKEGFKIELIHDYIYKTVSNTTYEAVRGWLSVPKKPTTTQDKLCKAYKITICCEE